MSSPSRRLTTLWFADIAGFTRLSATDEALALQVMEVMRQCVRKAVGARQGKVIKFLGDGALAEFPSAEGAVMAALEAAARFEGGTRALAGGPYRLHTGVHVGDVVDGEDGDIFGDGVNRAQRVESLGKPGQTLISEEVYRLVRRRPELTFTSLGQQTAKGLEDEPFEVFLVGPRGELATKLAALEKGGEGKAAEPPAPPQPAAAAPAAPAARTTRRLVPSFGVGPGIAAAVLAFVGLAVWSGFRAKPDAAEARSPIPDTLPPLVHDAAMAMPIWPARSAAEVLRAGPKTPTDLAAAGEQYFAALGRRDLSTHEILPTLRRAVADARAGSPAGARADAIKGVTLFVVARDFRGASSAFQSSIKAAPDVGATRVTYAQLLTAQGNFDEAKLQLDQARGKKDVPQAMYDAARGALLFRQGQFGDARGALNNALKTEPDVLATRILLARAQLMQNKFDDARKTLSEKVAHPEVVPWMTYAQLRANKDKDKNAKPSDQMLQLARGASSGYAGALLLYAAGQQNQALGALERMAKANDPDLIWLGVDPEWVPLRSDRRFRALTSR